MEQDSFKEDSFKGDSFTEDVPEKKNSSQDSFGGASGYQNSELNSTSSKLKSLELNNSNIVKGNLVSYFRANSNTVAQKAYVDKLAEIGYDKDKLNMFAQSLQHVENKNTDSEAPNLTEKEQKDINKNGYPFPINLAKSIDNSLESIVGGVKQVGEGLRQTDPRYAAEQDAGQQYYNTPEKIVATLGTMGKGVLNVGAGATKAVMGTAMLGVPELAATNLALGAVKSVPDNVKSTILNIINPATAGLSKEEQGKEFDKVLDTPFSLASTTAEMLGYKPEDGSAGKATLELIDNAIPIIAGMLGSKHIKTTQDFTDVSNKIADNTATPEQITEFAQTIKAFPDVPMQDISQQSGLIHKDVSHHTPQIDKIDALQKAKESPGFNALSPEKQQRLVGGIEAESQKLQDNIQAEQQDHAELPKLAGDLEVKKEALKVEENPIVKQGLEDDIKQGEQVLTTTQKLNEVKSKLGRPITTEEHSDIVAMLQDAKKSYSTDDIVKTLNPDYKVEAVVSDFSGDAPVEEKKGGGAEGDVPESMKPLLKDINKYKTAKEFENAHTMNSLMDLSNPKQHRFGRLFIDNGEGEIQDVVRVNEIYGKDLKYNKDANVPSVTDPNQMVTIYRSAHKGAKKIEAGDWVSFSKDYAHSHDRGKLLTMKVPAKDVIFGNTDFSEWVYSPKEIRDKYSDLQDFYNKHKAQELKGKDGDVISDSSGDLAPEIKQQVKEISKNAESFADQQAKKNKSYKEVNKKLASEKDELLGKLEQAHNIILGEEGLKHIEDNKEVFDNAPKGGYDLMQPLLEKQIANNEVEINKQLQKEGIGKLEPKIGEKGEETMVLTVDTPHGKISFDATRVDKIKDELTKQYPSKVSEPNNNVVRNSPPKFTVMGNWETATNAIQSAIDAEQNIEQAKKEVELFENKVKNKSNKKDWEIKQDAANLKGAKERVTLFEKQRDLAKIEYDKAKSRYVWDAIEKEVSKFAELKNELDNVDKSVSEKENEIDAIKSKSKKAIAEKESLKQELIDLKNEQTRLESEYKNSTKEFYSDKYKKSKVAEFKALEKEALENVKKQIKNGNITESEVEHFVEHNNPEQSEPIIADIERKAESDNEAELNEVIAGADELIRPEPTEKEGLATPPEEPVKETPVDNGDNETFSVKKEIADANAEKHGLKEAVAEASKSAARDFGTVWENAKEKIDNKEVDLAKLRKQLAENPIPEGLNQDETNALLLHDQIQLENEVSSNIDAVNSGKLSPDDIRNLQNKNALLRNDLFDNFVASKKLGTEQGRGLNARKLLADREFSLSNMENELRAEQNGEPLTPAQEAYVAERYKAITEKAKEWDDFQKNKEDIFQKFREKVEKEIEAKFGNEGRKIIQGGKKIANGVRKLKTKDIFLLDDKGLPVLDNSGNKIKLSESNFYNEAIEIVAKAIENGAVIADAISRGVEHLRKQDFYKNLSDESKKSVEDSFTKKINSVQETKESARLESAKKRWETLKQKYRDKRLREDFSKEERKRLIYDEEAIRLQSELQHEKDLFQYAKEQARLSKLGWGAKAMSGFNSLIREGLLSSPKTLGKLLAFDLWRAAIIRPLYNATSIPLRIIPKVNKIAGKAIAEGSFNGKSLLKGEKAFIEKNTYERMWDKLKKGGKSDLDLAFGDKQLHLPMFTTRTHGAIKQLGFQVEYNYVKDALDRAAAKAGRLDDPSVQDFNNRYAYAKGMDAIYMKDSRILKQYQLNLNLLENDKYGNAGKIAAFGARFLFPIVKVPYNFGKDVMYKHSPVGLSVAARQAFKADVSKLTTEEADNIMLNLKKGAVGTAMLLLGGYTAQRLGGLYSPDDKKGNKNNGLEPDEIKVGNFVLPAWMNHNVLTQAAQDGAEVVHLFQHAPKDYGTTQKILSAIGGAEKEQAKDLPFLGEAVRDVDLFGTDKAMSKIVANKVGQGIPALIQWYAQQNDTEAGKGFHPFTKPRIVDTKGKTPADVFENVLQSKIPYERNKLPTKKK